MEEYISDFKQVINKFEDIDKVINRKLNIYLIGGAVLLYAKLKSGTKDIDLVVNNKKDYELLTTVLKKLNFLIEFLISCIQNFKLLFIFTTFTFY